jgi:hypothetical protein
LEYGAGGELVWHRDHDSVYTMALMISAPEVDFQGGSFVISTAGSSSVHEPVEGDILVLNPLQYGGTFFDSNAEHSVETLYNGARSVLVVEFWEYEDSISIDILRPEPGEGGRPKTIPDQLREEPPTTDSGLDSTEDRAAEPASCAESATAKVSKGGYELADGTVFYLLLTGALFGLSIGILLTLLATGNMLESDEPLTSDKSTAIPTMSKKAKRRLAKSASANSMASVQSGTDSGVDLDLDLDLDLAASDVSGDIGQGSRSMGGPSSPFPASPSRTGKQGKKNK